MTGMTKWAMPLTLKSEGEDDMPEGDAEGEEPVFQTLSGMHLCLPACCSPHLPNLCEQRMSTFIII